MSENSQKNHTDTYRGRFAPSPTGPLHFGSLIAAVASYLEAHSRQGNWLVRMEDVDELRNVDGAADDILFTLEAFGFEWDEDVLFQTHRKEAYLEALERLEDQGLVYRCTCSRRDLREKAQMGNYGLIYPGLCDHKQHPDHVEHAIRLRTRSQAFGFTDSIMGIHEQNLRQDIGDFIIRRRDGLFAYQLAVVVDDAFQNISHVVRGYDLLDSTPRQLYLQNCLDYPALEYAHLPVAVNPRGDKLSKQTGARGIGRKANVPMLVNSLAFLGQQPPGDLARSSVNTVWQWARENWDLSRIPKESKIIHLD